MNNCKILILIQILLSQSKVGWSQIDTANSNLEKYDLANEKSVIIYKARRLLVDQFLENDIPGLIKTRDYLLSLQDNNYLSFYPIERFLIQFTTGEYQTLADELKQTNLSSIKMNLGSVMPIQDGLLTIIKSTFIRNEIEVKTKIQFSNCTDEVKQFLLLFLDSILLDIQNNIYLQDELNERSDLFLKQYPNSEYENFIYTFIRYKEVPSNWRFTAEFFSGYCIYTNELSNLYTNNIPVGVAFDVCYKRLEIFFRNYIGIHKTKVDIPLSTGTWKENSRANTFLPEASFGYVIYDKNKIKLTPFLGIASTDIGPTSNDEEKKPELKNAGLPFTLTYVSGLNLDINFLPRNGPKFAIVSQNLFLRIRYGFANPRFEKKFDVSGNLHYLTIGIGMAQRRVKKENALK